MAKQATDTEAKSFYQHIQNKQRLAQTYMSFVKHGGLFIPTDLDFSLGDQVELRLRLFTEAREYKIPCKVVWITPRYAQEGRVAGVGLQFQESQEATDVNGVIHNFLKMMEKKERRSDTL